MYSLDTLHEKMAVRKNFTDVEGLKEYEEIWDRLIPPCQSVPSKLRAAECNSRFRRRQAAGIFCTANSMEDKSAISKQLPAEFVLAEHIFLFSLYCADFQFVNRL